MHAILVENGRNSSDLLAQLVAGEGFTWANASSAVEAHVRINEKRPDIVIVDAAYPDAADLRIFEQIQAQGTTKVVWVSNTRRAVNLDEVGTPVLAPPLLPPINTEQLKSLLGTLRQPDDACQSDCAADEELSSKELDSRLLGNSLAMKKVYSQIARVAPTSATVFITGESGTGKELVTRTIHDLSRRGRQPLVAVNCGAISPHLIESELFGHEKGSFTGALREHKGYFERATGGTLFLDEITEMPAELQVKLLRVLESGVFMRVGSVREIAVDVRIIAATNRSCDSAVADGKIREDLLYRLQVFPLHLPPLRERGRDIELLALRCLDELNQLEQSNKQISREALDLLMRYHWPGNVRELKNAVQRAYILADDVIDASCFSLRFEASDEAVLVGPVLQVRVGSTVADAERRLILATLEHCHSTREKAADMLGISLKTLYNRLREYGTLRDFPKNDAASDGERSRLN